MEAIQPHFTTSVRSDAQGDWLQGIEQQLSPGMHRVIATDEQGNQDQALLYVVKQEPNLIQQVTSWVPPYLGWLVVSLVAISAVLGTYAIRVGQRAYPKKERHARKKYMPHAVAVSVLLVCIALGLSYWANTRTQGELLKTVMPGQQEKLAHLVEVKGSIRKPFTGEGVEGVDLVAGNTHIRTLAGGRFQFTDIDQYAGIKLTHPELKIALRFAMTGKDMDIPFDPSVYNALFDLMQRESRGRGLAQDGPTIFGPQDQAAQELRIGMVGERKAVQLSAGQQAADALVVELWSGEKMKTCFLKGGAGQAQLIECR